LLAWKLSAAAETTTQHQIFIFDAYSVPGQREQGLESMPRPNYLDGIWEAMSEVIGKVEDPMVNMFPGISLPWPIA
jgi:hypothetical protein